MTGAYDQVVRKGFFSEKKNVKAYVKEAFAGSQGLEAEREVRWVGTAGGPVTTW